MKAILIDVHTQSVTEVEHDNTLDNIYELLDTDLQNIANFRRVFGNNTREYKTLIENSYKKHFINNKYIDIKVKEYIRNKQGSLVIYRVPFKDKTISINIINYS